MAIDIIARGMIESSKSDISHLFDITRGGETANGSSSYTLNNAVDYPLLGLNLYGKSTQDGTPTPENPVDIVSVGDSGSVAVQACGKNLFDYSILKGFSSNGITYTNNNDGSFTVSGVKTDISKLSYCAYKYNHKESLQIISSPGTYTISGVPKDYGKGLHFYINFYYGGKSYNSFLTTSNNTTNTVTEDMFTEDFRIDIGFFSFANYECKNGTFYPQIEKGSTATDFEPYKGNTASITSALPLCGIPVSEGGNYTDSNGQRWVCDEMIYNADGTGKIVKRTAAYTITEGTNVGFMANSGSYQRAVIDFAHSNIIAPKDGVAICSSYRYNTYFRFVSATQSIDDYAGCFGVVNGGTGNINMRFATTATTAEQFVSENLGVKIIYQRAEPQEIELTASEISALRQLQTFNGITNISNDSGADMGVKFCTNKALSEYVIPITTGLQKQIDELKAAVISLGGNV